MMLPTLIMKVLALSGGGAAYLSSSQYYANHHLTSRSFAYYNIIPHNHGKSYRKVDTSHTWKCTTLQMTSEGRSTLKNKKRKGRRGRRNHKQTGQVKNPNEIETWRVYGLDVNPDDMSSSIANKQSDDIPSERSYLTPPVLESLLSRLGIKSDSSNSSVESTDNTIQLPPQLMDVVVVRRSIDARRRRGADPKYTYVVDIKLKREVAVKELNLSHQPGRMERLGININKEVVNTIDENKEVEKPKIVIVGAGPAGLFCALSLASSGLFTPILLERGLPVEGRGKSIGALIHRRNLDPESNFSFGEGGAGTWSDGKLTTRIGRNSEAVRFVLETLVKYGAPEKILVEGAPHLGTDNLVRLLRNMRADLRSMGGEVHFGSRANKFHIKDGSINGVEATCIPVIERGNTNRKDTPLQKEETVSKTFCGDAVVLATGHSARDVYYELNEAGVELEAKGFAVGYRIEHPQSIINEIQYGKDWGARALCGKISTDKANIEHFKKDEGESIHTGKLPVASYRLATNEAFDGESNRGAYSFCMCPGGQIVPSSTEPTELCINGMSFSKRDSLHANSALVVTVNPDDQILDSYREKHGCLAGLQFQRDMEARAFELGGGDMRAPVQRLTDYVNRKVSSNVPSSSYRLGVKSAACHDIYPQPIYKALSNAIINHFDKQMPGFLCDEALLHGVETRTSSPVRVKRDANTLQAIGVDNLFPCGEGAGFAGGIVSAAVDGLTVANSIKSKFASNTQPGDTTTLLFNNDGKASKVGFDY